MFEAQVSLRQTLTDEGLREGLVSAGVMVTPVAIYVFIGYFLFSLSTYKIVSLSTYKNKKYIQRIKLLALHYGPLNEANFHTEYKHKCIFIIRVLIFVCY